MAHLHMIGRRADHGEPTRAGQTMFAASGNNIRQLLSLGIGLGVPVGAFPQAQDGSTSPVLIKSLHRVK